MRARKSIPLLISELETTPFLSLYWECAKAVGALGSRRATRPLIAVVRSAKESNRRAAALHALWLLADRRAVDVCPRVAADLEGEDEHTRLIAAEALLGLISGGRTRRQRWRDT